MKTSHLCVVCGEGLESVGRCGRPFGGVVCVAGVRGDLDGVEDDEGHDEHIPPMRWEGSKASVGGGKTENKPHFQEGRGGKSRRSASSAVRLPIC